MRLWWLTLVLCACNQIYDLDETRVRELDRDEDSISDDEDNCIDVANASQTDIDGDGRGDACDGCTSCLPCEGGADHDEDGDLHDDACDNCPTVPNPTRVNVDDDDLGDACDPDDTTPQRRVLFDGFATIASTWVRTAEWKAIDDAAEAIDGPHPLNYRLTSSMPLLDGTRPWSLEIQFDVPPAPADRDSIGASIVNVQGDVQWACTVVFYIDSGWNLTNGPPATITLPVGPTRMTLSSQRGGLPQRYCRVPNNPEKDNGSFNDSYPAGVELFASRPARFAYIEVIQ